MYPPLNFPGSVEIQYYQSKPRWSSFVNGMLNESWTKGYVSFSGVYYTLEPIRHKKAVNRGGINAKFSVIVILEEGGGGEVRLPLLVGLLWAFA